MSNLHWQTLAPFDISSYDNTETALHRAAQLLAMVGKNYLPNKEDDSHANIEWSPEQQTLMTWPLPGNGIQAALHIPSFQLQLRNTEGQPLGSFEMHGATKKAAFDWLGQALAQEGLPAEKLHYISHYDMPEHPTDNGAVFERPDAGILISWMAARSNANLALNQLTDLFEVPSDVRIWPHHFDTGIYHSLEGKGIGMGLAITDAMFHEPYFYTYVWSPDEPPAYDLLPVPKHGGWHIEPGGWNGGFLRVSKIFEEVSGAVQQQMVMGFLKETTNSLLGGIGVENGKW